MQRRFSFALLLAACFVLAAPIEGFAAASKETQLAQARPAPAGTTAAPAPAGNAAATAADTQPAIEEPIGNVANVTGTASVIRDNETTPLKVKDDIYLNDIVQTAASSSLGITFNDTTSFNLKASARITIDNYVYEDGGKNNSAIFDVARGTVAFVAAAVAKTGDMKISTPTATLGIRGTTGLVEVPAGAAANNPNNVAIKLYPDPDGKVGRIEVNDRAGARLGFLTQGASGFTIRPGVGGARVAAVPLAISPQQVQRDQGFVRQVHATQSVGRQVVDEQRAFRRANPGVVRGNPPRRSGQPGQPRQNGLPGQNPTRTQPGQPARPGQPQAPGQQNQNRPGQPPQPALPNRQGSQPQRSGSPQQTTAPGPLPAGTPPSRPPQQGAQPPSVPLPNGQQIAPRLPDLRQGLPRVLRPGLPGKPALPPRRGAPPKSGKPPPKEIR